MTRIGIENQGKAKSVRLDCDGASLSPRGLRSRRIISIALFIFALVFYYLSVLRLPLRQTNYLDLGPYPDAVEYFAQAKSILRSGMPTIQIGYDKLPSRYPPGYPALMIPWLKCLPHNGILAPFRTNQTIGLLLLLGGFIFYMAMGRPIAAGLWGLFLATLPAFVTFSRSSMSDLSAAAGIVIAYAAVYSGLRWKRRWPIYLAAVVLGLSICIRAQLLFFAPLLIGMAVFPHSDSRWRWFLHCVLVLLAFVIAASPYLILNTLEFGHPLQTGYDFWVPALRDSGMPFSLRNVPLQAATLWSEITASWTQFRVANLFGTGTYVVSTFLVLSLLGAVGFVRFRPFVISAFLAGGVFFISTITFSYVDVRLYMPIFFLLVALSILPGEWALENVCKKRFTPAVAGVLVLSLAGSMGYPSQSGFPPKPDRAQAWDAVASGWERSRSVQYEAQGDFMTNFRQAPGIVLSDIDPVYLNALWPVGFFAAPLDGEHSYRYSKLWHYGRAEALQFVRDGLSKGIPVYALLTGNREERSDGRLPLVTDYRWTRSEKSTPGATVLILSRSPTGEDGQRVKNEAGWSK